MGARGAQQSTPASWRTTERSLLVDLTGAVLGAAAVWVLLGPPRVLAVDAQITDFALAVAAAVVTGVVAFLGVVGARTLRHPRPAWLGAAFGLYGATVVSVSALNAEILLDTPRHFAAVSVADLGVVVLLLVAPHAPRRLGAVGPWAAAAVVAALAAAVATAGPGIVTAATTSALQAVTAAGWVGVALIGLVTGVRRRRPATVRAAVGLGLLAAAHVHRVLIGADLAAPDLLFTGLQLLGVLGVLAGSIARLDGEVIHLLSQRDRQRQELLDAARHAQLAAELARERDHELANGLAGLSGIALLLDQETPGAAHTRGLRSAVLAELTRLHSMLAGAPDAVPDVYDVAGVVTDLATLRRAAGLDVHVVADRHLYVAGERHEFAQVLVNLLANCERHAPGSPVWIEAHRQGPHVVVEVRDEGPGIPDGDGCDVVQRGATAGLTGGSGLGLHVSAQLLDRQGGGLRVLAARPEEPGFGIRVELPVAGSAPPGDDGRP